MNDRVYTLLIFMRSQNVRDAMTSMYNNTKFEGRYCTNAYPVARLHVCPRATIGACVVRVRGYASIHDTSRMIDTHP